MSRSVCNFLEVLRTVADRQSHISAALSQALAARPGTMGGTITGHAVYIILSVKQNENFNFHHKILLDHLVRVDPLEISHLNLEPKQ